MDAVKAEKKVLLSFRIGDLWIDPFLYEKGDKQGQPGASLKGRLLFIDWIKVNGTFEYKAPARQEATAPAEQAPTSERSEEHTSELQSLMRISYAVFCLKKKNIHLYIKHNNARY